MVNFLDKHIFSPDKQGRKPTILVNIADDDLTRGDTAGRMGLSKVIAQKIDADIIYADQEKLNELYPDITNTRTPYEKQLALFLSEHRSPDIVLGVNCTTALSSVGKHRGNTLYLTGFNETLSSTILDEGNIVAHHLTNEMLDEEGKKFDEVYPKLKKPIISVFLVDPQPYKHAEFVNKLTSIAKQYKESTIFLCGSRRTDDANYLKLKALLEKNVKNDPQKSNIDIEGFRFDRNADFNPYRGLIARADHFILWGDSMSMMSEPLITGKTVHLHDACYINSDLKKMDIVADFRDASDHEPLPTKYFPSVNITEKLADKIIDNLKEQNKVTIHENEQIFKRREYPKSWHNHLTRIYIDYNHIANAPKRLRDNPDFIKAALEQNGMAIKLLPKNIAYNVKFGEIAAKNNPLTLPLLGDAILDNSQAMFRIINSVSPFQGHLKLYDQCSDRLKSCPEFSLKLLKSDVDIPLKMDQSLFKYRNICLYSAKIHPSYVEKIPQKFMKDQNFVKKMLQENSSCFKKLTGKQQRQQLDVLLKTEPMLICFASEKIRDDETIMTKFVSRAYTYSAASERLCQKKSFILKAFEHNDISYEVPIRMWRDKDILLASIKYNFANIRYSHHSLMNDPEICKACLLQDPANYRKAWQQLTPEAQENPDICFTAVKVSNFSTYQWDSLSDKVRQNKDFVLRCANLPNFTFQNIDKKLYSDPAFIKKIIETNPEFAKDPNFIKQVPEISLSFNTLTPKIKQNKSTTVKKKNKQTQKLKA